MTAIGEDHGGWAVPWFHHGCVVFIEGAAALVHGGVLFPGFRDHHHGRLCQWVARHGQQFDRIVERGGVGLAIQADGVQLLEVVTQNWGLHDAFASTHPVEVALDGVDFTVVRNHAVWVSQWPFREGVGRETLVHQGQGRGDALILQVDVVLTDLVGQQQALVDDGAARHARHVVLGTVGQVQALDLAGSCLADDVQLAFQGIGNQDVCAAANEDLADDWLFFAHGGRHGHVGIHWHITPAQQDLAFGLDGAFHLLLTSLARSAFLGQEDHANAVLARWRQLDTLLGHLKAVELVRDLDQQARTVTHQWVGTNGTTVVDVFQDLQTLTNNAVCLLALDVSNEADAASVMLGVGVHAQFGCGLDFLRSGHRSSGCVRDGLGREHGSRSRLGHVGAPDVSVEKQHGDRRGYSRIRGFSSINK